MDRSAKTPCEAIVWYVLPALRRELALELVGLGRTQREVAGLLGVTEAAISQYMAAKRGKARWLDSTTRKGIRTSARRIAAGSPVREELCGLCTTLKLAGAVASLDGPPSRGAGNGSGPGRCSTDSPADLAMPAGSRRAMPRRPTPPSGVRGVVSPRAPGPGRPPAGASPSLVAADTVGANGATEKRIVRRLPPCE